MGGGGGVMSLPVQIQVGVVRAVFTTESQECIQTPVQSLTVGP